MPAVSVHMRSQRPIPRRQGTAQKGSPPQAVDGSLIVKTGYLRVKLKGIGPTQSRLCSVARRKSPQPPLAKGGLSAFRVDRKVKSPFVKGV